MTDQQTVEACMLAGAFVLVLGPAAVSARLRARRAPRPDKPVERLPAVEAGSTPAAVGGTGSRSLRADLLGCLGFGFVVVGLIATALIWDVPPWQR